MESRYILKQDKLWPIYEQERDFKLEEDIENLKIHSINKCTDDHFVFIINGVHVSLANAFRRIMISEVPTMAITHVEINTNDSLMDNDILASRLGLLPLTADPRLFEYKKNNENDQFNETSEDTIKFELKLFHPLSENGTLKVLSKDIKWIPLNNQDTLHGNIGCVSDKVLINKLNPGMSLDITMYATKGLGKDHAKFSPVGTASYRMLPKITLKKVFEGEKAHRLKELFPDGVISVVTTPEGKEVAQVENPAMDYCSRNYMQDPEFEQNVEVELISDKLIFSIESLGSLPASDIFHEAINIMLMKCQIYTNKNIM